MASADPSGDPTAAATPVSAAATPAPAAATHPAFGSAAAEPAPETLTIAAEAIRRLDLAPLDAWAGLPPAQLLARAGQLELAFAWPRADDDPRELSEIPELRLWSLRADARHPWLPLVLERSRGLLTRHVAMLLPHGFSRSEGIRFAPESLDLWLTHRLFLLDDWLAAAGLDGRAGLGQMAAVLGFELDPGFWLPRQADAGAPATAADAPAPAADGPAH